MKRLVSFPSHYPVQRPELCECTRLGNEMPSGLDMQSHIPSLIRMAQAQPGKVWGVLTAGVPSFLLDQVLRKLCREQYCPLAVRDQNWKSRSLFLFHLLTLSGISRAMHHSQSKGNGSTQFTKSRPESSRLCLPCLSNDSCRVWSGLRGSEECI